MSPNRARILKVEPRRPLSFSNFSIEPTCCQSEIKRDTPEASFNLKFELRKACKAFPNILNNFPLLKAKILSTLDFESGSSPEKNLGRALKNSARLRTRPGLSNQSLSSFHLYEGAVNSIMNAAHNLVAPKTRPDPSKTGCLTFKREIDSWHSFVYARTFTTPRLLVERRQTFHG